MSTIALLSRTFLLRTPSECLPLYTQRAGEDLSSDDRLVGKAVFGPSEGKLTIQLNRRKRVAGGPNLVRARICEDQDPDALELHVPRLFCPACQLWPAARELASAGEELFPGWAGQKVLSELRRFANLKAWRGANRLGAHPLRRGAARATLEAGGSFPQLLRPGQLHSSAHQLYLDLGDEEPSAMASIMPEASENAWDPWSLPDLEVPEVRRS